ncbi:MAG: NTP transferase domain-containing protein [Treponema sp.]|nr:NTP transferase domain-containing protein [Treponema sp.]
MNMSDRMYKVDNAIILAAGFGSRFVPVTYELPKGLVPVRGEPLLERQIKQLLEKGIDEIYIVVGYLKEKFEYLIDKYGVKLIYNPEYAVKNNLSSVYYARRHLKNSYILSADNWMEKNIFNSFEEKNWYSCVYRSGTTSEWCVKTDDCGLIKSITIGGCDSWVMYGPVFISCEFSGKFIVKIEEYFQKPGTENYMWENVLIDELKQFSIYINMQPSDNVYEFETLEELREFDPCYREGLPNNHIKLIENIFKVKENEITCIKSQKAGMTNRSFTFSVNGESWIFRLPGEGTDKLINRKQELEAYKTIKPLDICDEIIFFDEENGIKISRFYNDAVNTSAADFDDVKKSMSIIRNLHQSGLAVKHLFDIESEIFCYLNLCNERDAIRFLDNFETLEKMKVIIRLVNDMNLPKVLCHIDSNPDNFIKMENGTVRLIDWEYAGMCDPIIDISMYAIYSYYSKEQTDELLKIYLQREPARDETIRLYAYAALGGYLWSLWTQYKQSFGVEFGEYGMKMYRYAKDFYACIMQRL